MGKRKRNIIAAAGILLFLLTGCGKTNSGQEDGDILGGVEIKSGTDMESAGNSAEINGNTSTGYGTDINGEAGSGTGINGGAYGGTGAGKSGQGQNDDPDTWQAAHFPLENTYTQVLSAGGAFYGLSDENGETEVNCINKESLEVKGTILLKDAVLQSGMAADEEGNLYVPAAGEESGLWKINTKDKAYEKIELEDCSDRNWPFLKGIETDAGGYSYIWCGMQLPSTKEIDGVEQEVWYTAERVYVKDREMKTVYYQEVLNHSGVDVLYFQIDGEGRPGFLVKDGKEIQLWEMDVAGQGLKEFVKLGTAFDCFGMEDANIPEHLTYTGRGWLYCRDNRLYEFRPDTREKVQILDLAACGVLSSEIVFLGKGEGRMEIITRDGEAGSLDLAVFTPGTSDKTLLTLGVIIASADLEKAVVQFNRDSAGYRLEIIDYSLREGSYEDGGEQLKLDVVTGKAPDIIAVSGIDYRIFAGKGVLADLYDFMEGDGELTRDRLVQPVLKAGEDQGHLYVLSPSFQLHSMWGYADVTEGKRGATFSELLRLLEKSGKDFNAVGGFSADEPVLTTLCCAAMDEFVDWEKGSCAFDGDYFKEVLSFAGNYDPGNGELGYLERIREREQVLTVGILSSVADYQMQKEIYGGNLGVIGYPTAGGSGTSMDFRGSALAVNARTQNKAGAWEFVKYFTLQGYDGQGFPTMQEQFDQVMEAAMEDDYADSENGGQEKMPKAYYGGQDGSIAVYAASREEVDAVRKLVESVENRYEMHPVIQNIINEEAEGYFSGQVNLDRTVDKIQNRVSLFLQESR